MDSEEVVTTVGCGFGSFVDVAVRREIFKATVGTLWLRDPKGKLIVR